MEIFRQRRSVREFSDAPVDPEVVKEMEEVILLAPTGKIQMKTKFKFVTSPETIKELAGAGSAEEFVGTGKIIVIFLKDENEAPGTPLEDISIASSHLEIYCASKGLGSCWIHLSGIPTDKAPSNEELVEKICNIPPHLLPHCMLVVGHPAHTIEPKTADVGASDRFV